MSHDTFTLVMFSIANQMLASEFYIPLRVGSMASGRQVYK